MSKKRKSSDVLMTVILVFIMLVGIAVFSYPAFSSWWNNREQSKAIENYNKAVASLNTSEKEAMLEKAHAYNESLAALNDPLSDYAAVPDYDSILDITKTGIMGYIDIPKIKVHLPVYHGTSPEVLNVAVGHLQGTSLPVGGIGCHTVISAHRGLPSAKLFTSLDQLTEDDRFTITVLDEVLTYEVDLISVVLPYETNLLRAEPDKDLVTLMTCTPYGINTHRLLVRAHRIDTMTEPESSRKVRIPADAVLVDNMISLPFILIPIAGLLMLYWSVSGKKSSKKFISAYTVSKSSDDSERNGESK